MSLVHASSGQKGPTKSQAEAQLTAATTYRQSRRRIILRRRKLPTIRLGGNGPNGPNKRGPSLGKMLRKIRLRWVKLRYVRMLKSLKEYYNGLVKDIIQAGATFEAYKQRLVMEASCAVPMAVSFNNFPSMAGSDHPRPFFLM